MKRRERNDWWIEFVGLFIEMKPAVPKKEKGKTDLRHLLPTFYFLPELGRRKSGRSRSSRLDSPLSFELSLESTPLCVDRLSTQSNSWAKEREEKVFPWAHHAELMWEEERREKRGFFHKEPKQCKGKSSSPHSFHSRGISDRRLDWMKAPPCKERQSWAKRYQPVISRVENTKDESR